MVAALVIMTAVFVMAGSLATTRQMWGFFSTKQLDRSNVEVPARADSANWLLQSRYLLLKNNEISQATYLLNITNGIVTGQPPATAGAANNANPAVLEDLQFAGAGIDLEPFPPFSATYPDYDTNSFAMTIDHLYIPSLRPQEGMLTSEQGSYDPYYGITNIGYSWGVVFRREMDDQTRLSRSGRFSETTTQLRAWASIDAALVTSASFRRFPLSAFTLYLASTNHNSVFNIGNLINPLSTSYNAHQYSVGNVGVGRVYVDGVANFSSNAMTLGFPMVANKGYTNTAQVNFFFPTHLGGGSQTYVANPADYKKSRYYAYRGMLASSYDRPQRLISMSQTNVSPFVSMPIAAIITNAYVNNPSSVYARLSLDTDNTNNLVTLSSSLGLSASEASRLTSTNIWVVDHTARTVALQLTNSGFFNATNFATPPTSMLFTFSGTNTAPWTLRVNAPNVGALSSDPSRQKLSIITPATLVVESNGFNSNLSGNGAMLVSPIIRVSGASGSVIDIGGVVVTANRTPSNVRGRTIGSDPASSVLTANVVGSMILIGQLGFMANTNTVVQLTPDLRYLSGESIPPAILTGLDMRITQEEMKTYTMFATEPIVLPPAY